MSELRTEANILKRMRAKMDERIIDTEVHQSTLKNPSRAITIAITKLEEAKMWMGKRFEEIEKEAE